MVTAVEGLPPFRAPPSGLVHFVLLLGYGTFFGMLGSVNGLLVGELGRWEPEVGEI